MKRPIAISLSPNTEPSDVFLALRLLVSPWRYAYGHCVDLLKEWFQTYFDISYVSTFNHGRTALFAILSALNLKPTDEVVLQAFTCVAVPNAVIASGATPIYADITKEFTIDPMDFEKKITKKTKAVIVQHTFGIPANMELIQKIAQKNNIFVIEDSAHRIGVIDKKKKNGIQVDASFFSFGRDKAFSSVSGGVAITNNEDIGFKLRVFEEKLENPSLFWIFQQLFHPIAFSVILPLYNIFSIGKVILVLLQKIHFLSFPITEKEKQGNTESLLMQKMPNALACLALFQVRKIDRYNATREKIVGFYSKVLNNRQIPIRDFLPLLRFPILVPNKKDVLLYMKQYGVHIGSWYDAVVDPKGVSLERVCYKKHSCPVAENAAKHCINFPTYPSMTIKDAKTVVDLFQKYGE